MYILACKVEHLGTALEKDGAESNADAIAEHIALRNKYLHAASALLGFGSRAVKVAALELISGAVFLYAGSPQQLLDATEAWLYVPNASTQEKAMALVTEVLSLPKPQASQEDELLDRFKAQGSNLRLRLSLGLLAWSQAVFLSAHLSLCVFVCVCLCFEYVPV